MLTIRLIKTGRKNNTNFRVVLIEKTAAPRSGKALEILGNYNPHNKEINLKEDRIKYWISQGVQTSETVHNILVQKKVIEGDKIKRNMKIKEKEVVAEEEKQPSENKEAPEEKTEEVAVEEKTEKVEEKQEKEQKEEAVKE